MEFMDGMKRFFSDHAEEVVSKGAQLYEEQTGKVVDAKKLTGIILNHDKSAVKKAMEICKDVDLVQSNSILAELFSPQGIWERSLRDVGGDIQDKETRDAVAERAKAVTRLIDTYNLRDPENLSKFLVQMYIAQIDSFNDSFNLLQDLHLNNYKAMMETGETYLNRSVNATDEAEKVENLKIADLEFVKAIHSFKEAISTYIKDVTKIVNRPPFLRTVGSSVKKLDNDMYKIKGMLETMQELVRLESWISHEKNNTETDMLAEYQKFFDSVIVPNLPTLKNYCKDEDDQFWESVEQNGNTILLME